MTERVDAVVIGGGVMGASILYNLTKQGLKNCVLLERDTLGSGSTGRSSGLIRMHYSTKVNAELSWKSFPYFLHFDELIGQQKPQFIKTGFIAIAGPASTEGFYKNVSIQKKVGIDTNIIDLKQAREVAPGFHFTDDEVFAWEPQSGHGDPSGTAMAYAKQAEQNGARIILKAPVNEIRIKNDTVFSIHTEKETFETEIAVMATGPWSNQFLSKLNIDLPLTATRHEVFFIKRDNNLLLNHPSGADMTNMTYFRPEGNDMTLVGNGNREHVVDPDKYNLKPSMDYLEDVWLRLAKRMPAIAKGQYFTGYAGLYTSTPDTHPIVDKIDGIDGLYICTGFSGHGFKLAPAVGICMSELITKGRSDFVDITALKADRFSKGNQNEISYGFRVIS
ncbi:MAG: sarcosine oxidase subunit beta [Chloroflexi bacterium]|jgi:sarcosine oxidase subunit beta|nr:MAG: sarcosine oxidase subunit beta [Chloroflexota bacterium]